MRETDTVLIADASHARILSLVEDRDHAELTRLELVASLDNQSRRRLQSEEYSDSRPGLRQSGAKGPGHAVDDHRDAADDESERRFAERIVAALGNHQGATGLVIAASPKMLGFLRKLVDFHGPCNELDKNLTAKSTVEIHDYLAERGLLRPRGRVV